jgi:hypothetical protein
MTNEQLGPKVGFGDIRLFFVIAIFGAIGAFLLPVCYLFLLLSDSDASGNIRKRLAKRQPYFSIHGEAFGSSRLAK